MYVDLSYLSTNTELNHYMSTVLFFNIHKVSQPDYPFVWNPQRALFFEAYGNVPSLDSLKRQHQHFQLTARKPPQ